MPEYDYVVLIGPATGLLELSLSCGCCRALTAVIVMHMVLVHRHIMMQKTAMVLSRQIAYLRLVLLCARQLRDQPRTW